MSVGGAVSLVRSGPQVRSAVVVLAVFLAFTAGAVASWESFGSTVGPSFFYPSAGVTAAALMLTRRSLWPAIAVAVVAAELLVDTLYGNPVGLSVAFAVSNVVEPVVGASIVLAWCGGRPDLSKRHDFIAFLLGACVAGPFGRRPDRRQRQCDQLRCTLAGHRGDVVVRRCARCSGGGLTDSALERAVPCSAQAAVGNGGHAADHRGAVGGHLLGARRLRLCCCCPSSRSAAFRLNMLGAALTGAVAAFLGNIMTDPRAGTVRELRHFAVRPGGPHPGIHRDDRGGRDAHRPGGRRPAQCSARTRGRAPCSGAAGDAGVAGPAVVHRADAPRHRTGAGEPRAERGRRQWADRWAW